MLDDDRNRFVSRPEFNQLDKRVSKIEERLTRNETKVEHMEDTLKEIRTDTKKIIWLIISAVILAVLKLVLIDGGL